MKAFFLRGNNAFWLLLPILGLPLFIHLANHPIFLWDEARQATNMLEMHANNNLLVTHFNGLPDHYNTKPPLLIWFQLFFYKMGFGLEWAMRLPSALAAVGTCYLLFNFSRNQLNNVWIGLIASFVLVSIPGYVELHGTRTGDYDALLCFFTTGFILSIYRYLKYQNSKAVFYFMSYFALAVATKAAVPFMFLPIIVIWVVACKQFAPLVSSKSFWLAILIPIVTILFLYGGREMLDPGYIQAAWNNDFGGRYGQAIDGHRHPFYYYLIKLWNDRAFLFFPLYLVCFIVSSFFIKSNKHKVILYLGSVVLFFLLILSTAQTKIYWYDTPIYPLIAISIASFASIFSFKLLRKVIYVVLILLSSFGYVRNVSQSYKAENYSWEGAEFYEPSLLLKKAMRGEANLANTQILFDNKYYPHFRVYNMQLANLGLDSANFIRNLYQVDSNMITYYFQSHVYSDSLKFFNLKEQEIKNFEYLKTIY